MAASALAAVPISRWMVRRGRRPGLALGYALAALGSLLVVVAAVASSLVVLLVGIALFGLGNTSNLLARFAAADLAPPERRGRAIATVLLATTFGAVLGPNLAGPSDDLGALVGLPPLAGPFALCVVAYTLGALVVFGLLRPDPLLAAHGRAGGAAPAGVAPGISLRASARALTAGRARAGLAAMVVANLVMVAIMTMTPVHLVDHGHSLAVVGFVISAHVAGMFLPSPVTGWLCDRVGRLPVLAAGGVVLAAAGLLAAGADAQSDGTIAFALALLGVGWNLGLIDGSVLLTDAVPLPDRPQAQGAADLAMGAVGALGSVLSGPALAFGGFALLGLSGTALALALLVIVARARLLDPAPGAS